MNSGAAAPAASIPIPPHQYVKPRSPRWNAAFVCAVLIGLITVGLLSIVVLKTAKSVHRCTHQYTASFKYSMQYGKYRPAYRQRLSLNDCIARYTRDPAMVAFFVSHFLAGLLLMCTGCCQSGACGVLAITLYSVLGTISMIISLNNRYHSDECWLHVVYCIVCVAVAIMSIKTINENDECRIAPGQFVVIPAGNHQAGCSNQQQMPSQQQHQQSLATAASTRNVVQQNGGGQQKAGGESSTTIYFVNSAGNAESGINKDPKAAPAPKKRNQRPQRRSGNVNNGYDDDEYDVDQVDQPPRYQRPIHFPQPVCLKSSRHHQVTHTDKATKRLTIRLRLVIRFRLHQVTPTIQTIHNLSATRRNEMGPMSSAAPMAYSIGAAGPMGHQNPYHPHQQMIPSQQMIPVQAGSGMMIPVQAPNVAAPSYGMMAGGGRMITY